MTVTAGFIDSWYVPAKIANPAAPPPKIDNPVYPANQNPDTIEAFVEALTGSLFDQVGKVDSIGGGKSSSTTISGTLYAIHLGAGELVYRYATALALFQITIPEGQGLGLSNFRVLKDTCTENCGGGGGGGDPNPVPVPGALPLLFSGLAGLGFLATRRKKTIAA